MKNLQLKTLLFTAAVALGLSACRKDKVDTGTPDEKGVYILNQGSFNGNNSTLTYYSFINKTTIADQFAASNAGSGLGDTGNDVKIYGSKMYIVVNVSSNVEVVNAKTTKSIKQIKMFDGATARQPRYVVFNKNKAFISSYDGTVAVLDTATLNVEKYIKVGRNPEQMVIANGKLYVANSGGLDFLNPDNSVSVIDLNSFTEIKKITVPSNPISISADAYGDVYVIAYNNIDYSTTLTTIDNTTDAVKNTKAFDAGYATPLVVSGDMAYYVSNAAKIKVYNVKTETTAAENFVTDGTTLVTPYGITIDNSTGEVYVTDALDYKSNGLLYAFDKTGKKEYKVTTGIIPGSIVLNK